MSRQRGPLHLAESPASNILVDLNLARNGLEDHAARYLGKSRHLKNLQILRLNGNEISDPAAATEVDPVV